MPSKGESEATDSLPYDRTYASRANGRPGSSNRILYGMHVSPTTIDSRPWMEPIAKLDLDHFVRSAIKDIKH